jgi:hypothetical protein
MVAANDNGRIRAHRDPAGVALAVTVTGAEVVVLPAASRARAVSGGCRWGLGGVPRHAQDAGWCPRRQLLAATRN